MKINKIANVVHLRLIGILIFAAIIIIFLGAFYYDYEAERLLDNKFDELTVIAKTKSDSIQDWQKQRLADVQRMSLSPAIVKGIKYLLKDHQNALVKSELQIRLKINRGKTVYADALFLDPRGNILLSDNPQPAPVEQATIKAIAVALKDRTEVLSNLFRDPKGLIYIDAVAPILDSNGQPIAVVVLRSKATDFLFPLIQSWPTASITGETLLVCRDVDSVLFLNELRHRSNSALNLKYPLTDTHLPGVQAALGKYGRFHGRDYRGVDVLAVTQPVPLSSWSIVAKIDQNEILSEVRYRESVIGIIVFLLITISAGLIVSVYRNRQEVERRKAEEELQKSEERYRFLFDAVPVGIGIADLEGNIHAANMGMQELSGYTLEGLKAIKVDDICANLDDCKQMIQTLHESGQIRNCEIRLKRKDGSIYHVLLNIDQIEMEGRRVFLAAVRDITDRKQAAEERERLISELQKALSEVKKLSGLLPICASCKKIRDDNGYWKQIESYISDHSEAEFSHGICPDCMKKLYPDLYEKVLKRDK